VANQFRAIAAWSMLVTEVIRPMFTR